MSQSSSKAHIKATKKSTAETSYLISKKQEENRPLTVSPCLTEDLSQILTKEETKCLWYEEKDQKDGRCVGRNRSHEDRKSAGKIIKNQKL